MASKAKQAGKLACLTGPIPTTVKGLPSELRPAARTLAPRLAEIGRQLEPLDMVKMVAAVVQDELAGQRKPQSGLAGALARGMVAREELKHAEGGSFSAEEARLALGGMSKEAVLKRYRKGQLLGWRETRQKAVRFPRWQLGDDGILPGLEEVLAILNRSKPMDDWARLLFFLNRREALKGERALDFLRRGEVEPIKRLAAAYAE